MIFTPPVKLVVLTSSMVWEVQYEKSFKENIL
jgi:hypothetical protein